MSAFGTPTRLAVVNGTTNSRTDQSDLIARAFGEKRIGNEWFMASAILDLSDQNRAMKRQIELLEQRLSALEKAGAR